MHCPSQLRRCAQAHNSLLCPNLQSPISNIQLLIRLRGLRPDVDIPIVYTGVRPGEKMHEGLLGDGEERCPTTHPHIFRIRPGEGGRGGMERGALEELIALAGEQRNGELVEKLYGLVE